MGLPQYKKSVEEETENVAQLTRVEFQGRNWTTAHLRLGEMQVRTMLSILFGLHAHRHLVLLKPI